MERFDDFIKERRYLLNVSPQTLHWYGDVFSSWKRYSEGDPKRWLINMREAGLQPVSINSFITGMNAYWNWAGENIHLKKIKQEQKILNTLSPDGISRLLRFAPKPSAHNLRRAHLVALTILDCGGRCSEILALRKSDVDLDNLCFRIKGKGSKERLVPFSIELRKVLFKWIQQQRTDLIFGTRSGTQVSVRNIERDLKQLGLKLDITGIRFSPHTLRHSFAVTWLKKGGDLYQLSRILGHSSISTTTLYLKSLGIDTLKESHCRYSPLSAARGNGR